MKKNLKTFALAAIPIALAAGWYLVASAQSREPITSQLDVGARNDNVTRLQTFLAANRTIYPEGLVTGYYGPLTARAVAQFQIAYGLPPVGRVGPLTLARINSLIAAGSVLDIFAPFIRNVAVDTTNNSATVRWTTSESATGKVYYGASPLAMLEGSLFTSPSVSGTPMAEVSGGTSHAVTISGLNSNTIYYFVVESTDTAGNVSYAWQQTFLTK